VRVFAITGAGISAESGIPTFRGKDGYWRKRQPGSEFDPMKLATPEAFARDPELVWEWYNERRQRIRTAKPNAAHEAIAQLSTVTPDFLLVTQNVDDLHARAGLPKEKMVQIHGDIFVTRCSRCEFSWNERNDDVSSERKLDRLKRSSLEAPQNLELPRCRVCMGLMRPGVVWFGEQLDPGKIERVEDFLSQGPCDLVLVVGTTALFGYIVDWAMRAGSEIGQLIEINPEETPLSRFATKCIRKPAAVALPQLVSEILEGLSPDPLAL
jgi:NAD-dependent deacetylase